ncbi:hypothetical protein FUA23_17360 [Neolewinella aurantiaca]|uniref:Lipoprotein n=1 Tax=Neolewinella aurantiaca TaxID=2602767 RepID=A0A5C7FE75_9BACT|nr:hypothetical protein [Neolewinella aurantiaca]TXF87827.1 hypothetical protein FUA23_17360 [Neolewinella aurantiaca]
MTKFLLTLSLSALFLLSACEEETATPTDFSADFAYFPIELNEPKYFALDSIVLFNTVGGIVYDTARLEVRETLVERYEAADGTETFRGERWDRRLPDGEWRFRQTFSMSRSNLRATRNEDNLSFTKMVFPVSEGKRWDGHTAFDDSRSFVVGGEFVEIYQGWDYRYTSTDNSIAAGSAALDIEGAVVIEQDATDNLITQSIAYEIYAPNIGLVERFIDARRTQCRICCNVDTELCSNLPWNEKAEKGFILKETFLR